MKKEMLVGLHFWGKTGNEYRIFYDREAKECVVKLPDGTYQSENELDPIGREFCRIVVGELYFGNKMLG